MNNNNERLRPQDLIENEIYYLETHYRYLIRFHKLEKGNIYGKSLVNISLNPGFKRIYSNSIGIHKLIRRANQEEIDWLIACEKANKFVQKKELQTKFVLPEKWYVRASNYEEDKILIKWRGGGHTDGIGESVMLSSKLWSPITTGYTEITFEQFKEHVLKKSITNEQELESKLTQEQKEELLAEAKAKYPKDTVYKGWSGNAYQVGNNIHITELGIKDGTTCHLYYFKKQEWVEIISKPEQSKNDIFKPGYVVVCENRKSQEYGQCFLVNSANSIEANVYNGRYELTIKLKYKDDFRIANESERESFYHNLNHLKMQVVMNWQKESTAEEFFSNNYFDDYYKRQIISNQPQKSVSSNIQSIPDINLKSSNSKKINNNIPIIKSI